MATTAQMAADFRYRRLHALLMKGSYGISDSLDSSVWHGVLLGYEIADDMDTAWAGCPLIELGRAPKRIRHGWSLRHYAFTALQLYDFTVDGPEGRVFVSRHTEELVPEDHRR